MTTLKDIDYPLRLCVEMMHYAAMGAEGKTDNMTAREIKDSLLVFFTDEQVKKAQQILTGKPG